MTLKLTLEYDGTGFSGWARQPGRRTVEGAVREALDAVSPGWADVAVAGRTDAGVHARGQVVSVEGFAGPPLERVADSLNAVLPADIAVLEAEHAPAGFHARFSARSRSYRYVVLNRPGRAPLEARRSWWWPPALDDDALHAAARLLHGEHDFTAFTPAETRHDVRRRTVVGAAWSRRGDYLEFMITADSFLRHMVRTLVGTMVELGSDAPARLPGLLQGAQRAEAGRTAPPWGLYLERVDYAPAAPLATDGAAP